MRFWFGILLVMMLGFFACVQERPYLTGYIKRVHDASLVNCDPYNQGDLHSCIFFLSAFQDTGYIYDVSAGEMLLAPVAYFPLKAKLDHATSLIRVMSSDPRFPFLLALDRAGAKIYPIRLFPSLDNSKKSFAEPIPFALRKSPYSIAGIDDGTNFIVIATFPDDGEIELISVDRSTGALNTSIATKRIAVGTKPELIVVDEERKLAVITDGSANSWHIVDMSTANNLLTGTAAIAVKTISVGSKTKEVAIAYRDYGHGRHAYGIAITAGANEIKLVNLDASKSEASLSLDQPPVALYVPDEKITSCCGGKKNWMQIATIDGHSQYITVTSFGGTLQLTSSISVDLTSESNLSLSKLHVQKILGGVIHDDSKIKREKICSPHQMTFYIAAYAQSKAYLYTDPVEREGHAYACPGEETATLFGVKSN